MNTYLNQKIIMSRYNRVLCCFCINSRQTLDDTSMFLGIPYLRTTLLLFIINWNKINVHVHFVCERRIEIEMGDLVWVSHYLQTIQPITIQESPLWRKSVLSHNKREEDGGQIVVEKLGFFSGNNFYFFLLERNLLLSTISLPLYFF